MQSGILFVILFCILDSWTLNICPFCKNLIYYNQNKKIKQALYKNKQCSIFKSCIYAGELSILIIGNITNYLYRNGNFHAKREPVFG